MYHKVNDLAETQTPSGPLKTWNGSNHAFKRDRTKKTKTKYTHFALTKAAISNPTQRTDVGLKSPLVRLVGGTEKRTSTL